MTFVTPNNKVSGKNSQQSRKRDEESDGKWRKHRGKILLFLSLLSYFPNSY